MRVTFALSSAESFAWSYKRCNVANANDLDLVIPTLAGYIFYKSMEGRAESEMDRTYGEKSLGNQKSFNKEAMMTEILKGGGESNLAKVNYCCSLSQNPGWNWWLNYLQVREQTNKRRQEIADSLTTYGSATPSKAAADDSSKATSDNSSTSTTSSASEASSSAVSEK